MGGLTGYLFTALASVVTVWASHHPVWHDPALWLLGVLGHHFGYVAGKDTHGTGSGTGQAGSL